MLFASIGDGIFPVFTSILMKSISPDMLFYMMALINLILFYLVWKVVEKFGD